MPAVVPISELQRNMAAISKECKQTQEPIYLTKNGVATLVLIDAETYDKEMALHSAVLEREERAYRAIMRGYEDELAGRSRSLEQARNDARRLREGAR